MSKRRVMLIVWAAPGGMGLAAAAEGRADPGQSSFSPFGYRSRAGGETCQPRGESCVVMDKTMRSKYSLKQ